VHVKARVYLAEDEPLAREALVRMFEEAPGWELLGAAPNGRAALEACTAIPPDVLVTDIRMPMLDGLELAAAVRASSPRTQVVFVTAHDEHAVAAFRLAAVDYLLKPVTDAAFRACLARLHENLAATRAVAHLEEAGLSVDALVRARRTSHRHLVVRSLGRVDIVPLADVVALRAAGNYVEVLAKDRTYMHRETLKSLAERLDPARFVQVHRSTMVALAHVRAMKREPHGAQVIMDGGATFAVGSRFVRALEGALGV